MILHSLSRESVVVAGDGSGKEIRCQYIGGLESEIERLTALHNIRNIRTMRADKKTRGRRAGTRVSATEAAKNFGRLVDRVREERATYVVERGGTPVAHITPVARASFTLADFKALASRLPHVNEEYLAAVERSVKRHNQPRVRRNPWER